jgi:hypothetical protein
MRALVSPPIALSVDVSARIFAEIGRFHHDDFEAFGPGFVASPRTGWDTHGVPLPEPDDFVVELHPSAPAHDDVHLFLRLVRVAVRKPVAGGMRGNTGRTAPVPAHR